MKKTKRIIITASVLATFTGVGVGLAEIERSIWQTRVINGTVGAINHVLFWPIFALDITPGSTLDTAWFFIPLMVPVLGFWSWVIVLIGEKLRQK